jgi:activator of 2-hydroxyglutaryl-CoA dehydratase
MAATAQAERFLGLDLGAAELKVALCLPNGPLVQKSRTAVRGRPLESLLEFRFDHPRNAPIRVAVTGVGQTLLNGLPACLCVNEVVATAGAVRSAFSDARTVIDRRPVLEVVLRRLFEIGI